MKQQIQAFQDALGAFQEYSEMLAAAATALRTGDRSEDLIVSLMIFNPDKIPSGIESGLLEGAAKTLRMKNALKKSLSEADVQEAILVVVTASRSLDGSLERYIDMQSPKFARVPPPYRFFDRIEDQLLAAFPRELDDPVDTPQRRRFQQYLETVENPWRK